jgi:glycosyltransferase involved in cell wall biosynthesis
MFFLPAFFDHYRKLGVEQFFILDDGSDDGSIEFLRSQPDCVTLLADLSFGCRVRVPGPLGLTRQERAGTLFKCAIPQKFLAEKYALYVDADEFLILPSAVRTLSQLIDILAGRNIDCVSAALIEFYPATLAELERKIDPQNFDDLCAQYPFFDGGPLVALTSGKWPRQLKDSASRRLFRNHGIKVVPKVLEWAPYWIQATLPFPIATSAWVKTPIIHWRKDVWMNGSHHANVPPTHGILLSLVHFKFTHDFHRRTSEAMCLKSHARRGQKYFQYHRLMSEMKKRGSQFVAKNTMRFRGIQSFESAGLTKWE